MTTPATPSAPRATPGTAASAPPAPAEATTEHPAEATTEHPTEATKEPATEAAFFDVDNTIVRGASGFHLARALHARGFFRTREILRFAVHQARYAVWGENLGQIGTLSERALGLMTGHRVDDVSAVGEEVYATVLEPRVFPGTRALLDAHLAAGREVWLVTATPAEIGDVLARHLGATGAIATVAEHEDGRYTGRLVGSIMHGVEKAGAVRALAERRGIDLAASYAYGDSINDVELLRAVGHPCAINPEPRLRRVARHARWPIYEFRTRPRRVARQGARTAGWAGGAWAAGAAVRSVVRRLR